MFTRKEVMKITVDYIKGEGLEELTKLVWSDKTQLVVSPF